MALGTEGERELWCVEANLQCLSQGASPMERDSQSSIWGVKLQESDLGSQPVEIKLLSY